MQYIMPSLSSLTNQTVYSTGRNSFQNSSQKVQMMLKGLFGGIHTTVRSASGRGLRASMTTDGNTTINYSTLRTSNSKGSGGPWEVL